MSAVSEINFAFSIVDLIATCFKYGKKLIEIWSTFKNAKTEVAERIIRIQSIWLRIEQQLQYLRRIAPSLEEEHQKVQSDALVILATKLKAATTASSSVMSTESSEVLKIRRLKYIWTKKKIDETTNDLEKWQGIFDPSWYLIMKVATPQVDRELQTISDNKTSSPISSAIAVRARIEGTSSPRVWLPADGLQELEIASIQFCSADIGRRVSRQGDISMLILETIQVPLIPDHTQMKKDIQELAQKLTASSPLEFGILNCKGVVKPTTDPQGMTKYTLIFRVPSRFSQVQSLRSVLGNSSDFYSLSDRIKFANELAKAICYTHTLGFVHKNVRPETALLLKKEDDSPESLFLAGYNNFRLEEGETLRAGDSIWEKNLYRHPTRQGVAPTEDHVMQHDIYSLGVCLLEIGLWQSFVSYSDDGNTIVPSAELGLSLGNSLVLEPWSVKERFEEMAAGELKHKTGTIYSNVVMTCLRCLDPENDDFANEEGFEDTDGVRIGVKYIRKILMELNKISV